MEKEQVELLLTSAGIPQKEAEIYTFLLENGPSKATKIFKKLGMKKGNTYALLNELEKKGLIFKKNLDFVPQPPLAIQEYLETISKTANIALESFKSLMPRMNSVYKLSLNKPTVRYLEGEEGLTEVFEDIYSPKEDVVFGCVDLEIADSVLPNHIEAKLIPKRVRNKVVAHSIITDSQSSRELTKLDKLQLRETKLIDKKDYPLPAEIDIYENKVAMLSFKKGEFIGIIVENEDFAQSLRSIFKLAFGSKTPCDENTSSKSE